MVDESNIATHEDPVGRARSNFIQRLNLARDGMPGRYEQVWTRTNDRRVHELCCIPFFPYGLSLGDSISFTGSDGEWQIESKSGHRTLRVAVQDDTYLHEQHDEFHGYLVKLGVLAEFRGHALGYCAVDIRDQTQADSLITFLDPLAAFGVLLWEWADPPVD